MPDPVTVWMVRPREERAARGVLSLEDALLSFEHDDGERTLISIHDVARARRHRGTPVLQVDYELRGDARQVLFYFVEPPPLAQSRGLADFDPRDLFLPDRSLRRATGLVRLRAGGKALKAEIEQWVRAIGPAAGR